MCKRHVLRNTGLAATLIAASLAAPVMVAAQSQNQGGVSSTQSQPPPGAPMGGHGSMMGQGMMGPGMMGGYGMGPGMMGGGCMMGRGMMGPGMMGGYGIGPGMMGGYGPGCGMGPGMMGAWQALDLNDKQREQLAQLQKDLAKTQLDLQSTMADEYAKLQELYAAEKPDTAAISKVYGTIADLQRQMMQANTDANNRMQATLTEAQRNQLQRWQRGMMMEPMMMGPMRW